MNATLSLAADSMQGTLHGDDRAFDGVSTDTRTLEKDQLFVALSGPNFDGGAFVGQACGKGAAGAVVSSLVDERIRAWRSVNSGRPGGTSMRRPLSESRAATAKRRSRK